MSRFRRVCLCLMRGRVTLSWEDGKTSMQYPGNLKNGTASRNENNALVESPKADKEA